MSTDLIAATPEIAHIGSVRIVYVPPLFPGKVLFELKSSHGLPLDFSIASLMVDKGLIVEWPSFIEAARDGGWWDFQTYKILCEGMADAGLPFETQEGIKARFKLYVLANPHPEMAS